VSVLNRAKFTAVLNMSPQHQSQLIQTVRNMLDIAEDNILHFQRLLQHQQLSELQQTLHKIRGGFATLGAEQLAEESLAIEHLLDTDASLSAAMLTRYIQLYRLTCSEMQAALNAFQPAAIADSVPLNLPQLYTMLLQQDMQACQLVTSNRLALEQLLTPAGAARFCQSVTALNFIAAAQMLEPFLSPDNEIGR
jgi:chemotaxis protein histidine kinase CheA